MLFVSCGFTVSHIYCQKGERWIIGSEMPPRKCPSDSKTCSKSSASEHHSQNEENQRQKDTFEFLFEFEGLVLATDEFKCITLLDHGVVQHPFNEPEIWLDLYSVRGVLISHGFLEYSKPDLAVLQVFRI